MIYINWKLQLLFIIFLASAIITADSVEEDNNGIYESWATTNIKVTRLKFSWTIYKFSFSEQQVGEKLISPVFSAEDGKKCNWRLNIYPKGKDFYREGYVSLYIYPMTCSLRAQFKLSILNSTNKEINVMYGENKFRRDNEEGFGNFIKQSYLLNRNNSVLLDSTLTVLCEMNITIGIENSTGEFSFKKDSELPLMTLNRRPDDLEKALGLLLDSKNFSDVIFVVNGKEFEAHKAVLAARSPVFQAMFMEDANLTKFTVNDMNPEVWKKMLRYLYTGETSNLEHIAFDMLATSQKYELESLKLVCEDILSESLEADNAVELFILSHTYAANELKNHAREFMVTHVSEVLNSTGFKKMIQMYPSVSDEILLAMSNRLSTLGY